jgi:hypothetical protein
MILNVGGVFAQESFATKARQQQNDFDSTNLYMANLPQAWTEDDLMHMLGVWADGQTGFFRHERFVGVMFGTHQGFAVRVGAFLKRVTIVPQAFCVA